MEVLRPLLAGADRLILVVDPDPVQLAQVGDELVARSELPGLSVGQVLYAALAELPAGRRPIRVRGALSAAIRATQHNPDAAVLLGDLSPLFDSALAVDALDVLRRCSRDCRLVALWPGTLTETTLCFAVPEHRHYRCWPRPATGVVAVR